MLWHKVLQVVTSEYWNEIVTDTVFVSEAFIKNKHGDIQQFDLFLTKIIEKSLVK